VAPPRDPFVNFERMRREIDELFGDVLGGRRVAPRRAGFVPAVDVYYCGDPPRAVITAELAGVDPDSLELEVRGREVLISGRRGVRAPEDRLYQQLEIEHGPFRRAVTLGADVRSEEARASFDNGVLQVELPLVQAGSRSRSVPIEVPDESS
jgi:HSP20 family protein